MTPGSHRRNEQIITKATEVLSDQPFGNENHRFLISADEAHTIGNAVARRDYATLNTTMRGAVEGMEQAYEDTSISNVQSAWEDAIRRTTQLPGDTLEYIQSNLHREALIHLMEQDTYGDSLDIEPVIYVKMLETLAFATAPDVPDFRERYYTSRSMRRSGTENALFARAMTTLDTLAVQEPGIRSIRDKLIDGDPSGFNQYLRRYSIMNLARTAYGTIADVFNEGRALEQRQQVDKELGSLQPDEELLLTHLLHWSILPPEVSEQRDKGALKRAALDRAASDYQLRRLKEHWSDERIDLIFDIARLGMEQNRKPNVYISSTFDNGAGLYLAVGLEHPRDPSKQIVIADNPVNGNALYFVDELLTTERDETPYAWQEVLGANKKIARDRGATRRYHTGNWVQVAHAVCEYTGSQPKAVKTNETAATPVDTPSESSPDITPTARQSYEAAIKMAEAILQRYR